MADVYAMPVDFDPFDPRSVLPEDMRRDRWREDAFKERGVWPALPPSRPKAEVRNLAPRVADPLTPVYETLSPAMGGYSLGTAATTGALQLKDAKWDEAAETLVPLVGAMAIPMAPKGALRPSGLPGKPHAPKPEPLPYELDPAGFYSRALETVKNVQRKQGSAASWMNELERYGVKRTEIEAMKLGEFFAANPHPTKDQLLAHMRENRVQLQESRYGGMQFPRGIVEKPDGDILEGVKGPLRWPKHTLDPSNPSNRESVLRFEPQYGPYNRVFEEMTAKYGKKPLDQMPLTADELRRLDAGRAYAENYQEQFKQGHFPDDPNMVAHNRFSLMTDAQGRKVLHLDESQYDWAQKIRDAGGARDEAKIADLQKRRATLERDADELRRAVAPEANARFYAEDGDTPARWLQGVVDNLQFDASTPVGNRVARWARDWQLVNAELRTAEASTPGHPLVNEMSTAMRPGFRKMIKEAVDSGVEGITLTPGALQNERFNLTKHVSALRYDPEHQSLQYVPARAGENFNSLTGRWQPAATVKREDLPSYVGRELAERLLATEAKPFPGSGIKAHILEDLGSVEIGGHGMREYYDRIYPDVLSKELKRLDPNWPGMQKARLKKHESPEEAKARSEAPWATERPPYPATFNYFPITPKIREAVKKGLPLFSMTGAAAYLMPVDHNPFAQ